MNANANATMSDNKTGMTRRDFLGIAGVASAFLLGLPTSALAREMPPAADKRVCLIPDAHVAGTTHVPGIAAIAEGLCAGDELTLEREPDNPYDGWAIRVFDDQGKRAGFIPRAVNEIPARLMDAGFRVFARVTDVELIGYWYKISIEVWLEA